jgi:hypothetical protein
MFADLHFLHLLSWLMVVEPRMFFNERKCGVAPGFFEMGKNVNKWECYEG